MTPAQFSELYPRLYHMAEAGTWPSIGQHGLMSTSAILDFFQVSGPTRERLESARRTRSERVGSTALGEVWLRDNQPSLDTVLRRTLVGVTLEEWYRYLNGRVFFWVSEARLTRFREAAHYRGRVHDILTVDTARLLQRHAYRMELSWLNTGATHPGATYPRGIGTFVPLASYPWSERRLVNRAEPVVELTVAYSVPDIAELVVDVTTK